MCTSELSGRGYGATKITANLRWARVSMPTAVVFRQKSSHLLAPSGPCRIPGDPPCVHENKLPRPGGMVPYAYLALLDASDRPSLWILCVDSRSPNLSPINRGILHFSSFFSRKLSITLSRRFPVCHLFSFTTFSEISTFYPPASRKLSNTLESIPPAFLPLQPPQSCSPLCALSPAPC